ncbi:hypothetical protein B0T16DRAFT_411205 [Cercophora newfieldiana]|uniref:Uncharacterized protein n=1 Tax=Cercophora newfieldiana TaxID=92897 RepID=A0AA40CNF6_9PEZI|nr:hypothetical protein B0T16DRAFT_411205 [Cercophora newfieldiana]
MAHHHTEETQHVAGRKRSAPEDCAEENCAQEDRAEDDCARDRARARPPRPRREKASQNFEKDPGANDDPHTRNIHVPLGVASRFDWLVKHPDVLHQRDSETRPRPVKDIDLLRMLEPSPDPLWTDEDQRKLEAEWDNDELRYILHKDSDSEGSLLSALKSLWRDCVRYLGCPPTDIISVDNGLQFHEVEVWRDSPVILSDGLCMALRDILFHPLWEADVPTLVMVLQFSVIARTDDRRTWKFTNPTCDRFIDYLIEEIDSDSRIKAKRTPRRSMQQLCNACHTRDARVSRSPFYRLFKCILKHHYARQVDAALHDKVDRSKDTSSMWQESFLEKPLLVTAQDVTIITESLEVALGAYGQPAFVSLKQMREVATLGHLHQHFDTESTSLSSAPSAERRNSCFHRCLEKATLKERRKRILATRRALQASSLNQLVHEDEGSSEQGVRMGESRMILWGGGLHVGTIPGTPSSLARNPSVSDSLGPREAIEDNNVASAASPKRLASPEVSAEASSALSSAPRAAAPSHNQSFAGRYSQRKSEQKLQWEMGHLANIKTDMLAAKDAADAAYGAVQEIEARLYELSVQFQEAKRGFHDCENAFKVQRNYVEAAKQEHAAVFGVIIVEDQSDNEAEGMDSGI